MLCLLYPKYLLCNACISSKNKIYYDNFPIKLIKCSMPRYSRGTIVQATLVLLLLYCDCDKFIWFLLLIVKVFIENSHLINEHLIKY